MLLIIPMITFLELISLASSNRIVLVLICIKPYLSMSKDKTRPGLLSEYLPLNTETQENTNQKCDYFPPHPEIQAVKEEKLVQDSQQNEKTTKDFLYLSPELSLIPIISIMIRLWE